MSIRCPDTQPFLSDQLHLSVFLAMNLPITPTFRESY